MLHFVATDIASLKLLIFGSLGLIVISPVMVSIVVNKIYGLGKLYRHTFLDKQYPPHFCLFETETIRKTASRKFFVNPQIFY